MALLLSIFPLPEAWQPFRPTWVFLVLSYWIIALPHRIGIMWAFIWGLLLDGLLGTSLGLHSFALCIAAFVLQLNYQRIRLYPYWKQALTLSVISFIYLLIIVWLSRLTGVKSDTDLFWVVALINGALWPWLFILLRDLRRYFKVM